MSRREVINAAREQDLVCRQISAAERAMDADENDIQETMGYPPLRSQMSAGCEALYQELVGERSPHASTGPASVLLRQMSEGSEALYRELMSEPVRPKSAPAKVTETDKILDSARLYNEVAELAALHANYPDASALTDLRVARQLVVRQGKCMTAMLAYLDEEKKKGAHHTQRKKKKIPDKHAERDAEIQQMVAEFNDSGGVADAETWLAHADSAKESIGPKAVTVKLTAEAVQQHTESLECSRQKFGPDSVKPNLTRVAKIECTLENSRTELEEAHKDLDNVQRRLEDVRLTVAEKVGHTLVSDVARYETALENLNEADPKQYRDLIQLVRDIGNCGALAKGRIVEVEVAGSLAKARVEEEVGADDKTVTVSMWRKLVVLNKPCEEGLCVYKHYEEGYDTSSKSVRTFPRSEIIGGTRKPFQCVTDATVEAASKNSNNPTAAAARIRDPKRPEFLVGLYCDAHASRGRVLALAEEAEEHINKANLLDDTMAQTNLETIVPGLKGMSRACVKTADKYGGSYVQLTDLCRMTFVCTTVEVAIRVIEFIRDHSGWTVVRVKNRLDPVFDASATGGYRDLLINARDKANGHIVELQLTFKNFFDIKKGGGHAVYKLARLLELNETETTHYAGRPTDQTLERIRVGILREVRFKDVEVTPAMRKALLTERGLLSRTCAIVSYEAIGIASLPVPVPVLRHLGQKLTTLALSRCDIIGRIPDAIGEHCTNLRLLNLSRNPRIEGHIPKNFGNLRKLHTLWLYDCSLSGPVPWESLMQMMRLRKLVLNRTNLSGELPTKLGRILGQLQELSLSHTQISGVIPASIGNCKQLNTLVLNDTQISGPVPPSIAQLTQLQMLHLHNTDLVRPEAAVNHKMQVDDDPDAMREFLSMFKQ